MKALSVAAVVLVLAGVSAGCGGNGGGGGGSGSDEAVGAAGLDRGVVAAGAQLQPAAGAVAEGITVVGTGSASAVPDVAEWSFGVQASGETAEAALRESSAALERVVAALRDAGVAGDDLQTEQVSVYPRTSADGRSVTGYDASSTVHATVREIERAGPVVDAAVAAGANQVYGPTLTVSDTREQYRAAVEAAYADARARAEAIAAEAGLSLGAPTAIVEAGGPSLAPALDDAVAAEAAAGRVVVEPGAQEVHATLTVVFAVG